MDRIGRYKIVRELGRGAMGVVYHAIDPNIGRPVAIKTIQLSGVRSPEEQERLRERLFREARSAGILSHPGIVTIYDVEQQGELAYIAMEYVDGPTLDQLLSGGQPTPPADLFSILGQTAAALDYAHGKGIVHRDIKPANIMIARDGTAKITDFGIAKVTASEQYTMTGAIVGTPHYMSPEQVQGQAVDGRSDQFSLAVITYEILTGEKPFTGEHLTTVVFKIVAEEPMAPVRLNSSLSGSIENVLRKGLAKKPDARYRTCQEFIEALERACAGSKGWKTMARGGTLSEPTVADVPQPAAAAPPVMMPPARRRLDPTSTTELHARRKTGFLTFLLAIVVAAGLLALIGWQAAPYLLQSQRPSETAGNTPPKSSAPAAPAPQSPAQPQPAAPAGPNAEPEKAEAKPSPMSPPAQDPAAKPAAHGGSEPASTPPVTKSAAKDEPPARRGPGRPAALAVTIISSPGGATATLDGRAETECTTPCSIDASPGRHTVALHLPGYQIERREIDVGTGPLEMPAIVLRAMGGTLMLSSVPPGAAVVVDGKRMPQITPAQIPLTIGTHKVTVEKDGKEGTQTVEIKTGITLIRIPIDQ
ncbi:MAG TPA: serine/threonine-protein kinase [Bryobacteraceae bacterium]|jgi:serine/threonine-protein kinase